MNSPFDPFQPTPSQPQTSSLNFMELMRPHQHSLAPQLAPTSGPSYGPSRRTVFMSHSHLHETESTAFLREFGSVFIPRHIGLSNKNDRIRSNDTEYVMSRIRQELIHSKSSVTIVLVGNCTHSRRYVDWEIKASLQQGERIPNGLLAIQLPSCPNGALLPDRLEKNLRRNDACGYARYYQYPRTSAELRRWIEEAFEARRGLADRIINPNEMMSYNMKCRICGVTH